MKTTHPIYTNTVVVVKKEKIFLTDLQDVKI